MTHADLIAIFNMMCAVFSPFHKHLLDHIIQNKVFNKCIIFCLLVFSLWNGYFYNKVRFFSLLVQRFNNMLQISRGRLNSVHGLFPIGRRKWHVYVSPCDDAVPQEAVCCPWSLLSLSYWSTTLTLRARSVGHRNRLS